MRLILVTAPTVEPVTLAQARQHLRLDATGSPAVHPDDDLVTALIAAARTRIENETGRALVSQKWRLLLESFTVDDKGRQRIELPKPPALEVTSVVYVDADGVEQAWGTESPNESWRLIGGDGGLLVPFYGVSWPATRAQEDAVRIEFLAGYGAAADDVPAALRQALLLDVAHLYENRAAVEAGSKVETPLGWEALVWPYRRPVAG